MTVSVGVKIDEQSFREADALLARIPLELRTNILPKALRAAARPAEREMRKLAPDSQRSGSRKKWSKRMKAQRSNTAPHKQTIGHSTIREYGQVVAIYVGPIHPAGNLINIIGHPHREVWWGKHTGRTLPPSKYVEVAGERTKGEQQSAFVATVRRETDKVLANA